jgi:hypothetical protein
MQWITVATPPFQSIEEFDAVIANMTDAPDGMEARYTGKTGDGLRIVTLWESKEHADRFLEDTLGPALAKALGPELVGRAQVVGIEVARSYVRERV